jgi:anti-sigma28 factor (negative regulator of flagellin synthesis)
MRDHDSSMFEFDDGQQANARQSSPCQDKDRLMEQILESMDTTPIGRVLKQIASLPEARKEKVLQLRRQITEGSYDVKERLDLALDRVLEDLTA